MVVSQIRVTKGPRGRGLFNSHHGHPCRRRTRVHRRYPKSHPLPSRRGLYLFLLFLLMEMGPYMPMCGFAPLVRSGVAVELGVKYQFD